MLPVQYQKKSRTHSRIILKEDLRLVSAPRTRGEEGRGIAQWAPVSPFSLCRSVNPAAPGAPI